MSFQDTIRGAFEIELGDRKQWTEWKDVHFHNCYEFYYLASGEVTYFVEDAVYTVKRGDVILIPPQTIHKTMPREVQRHKRILIYLTPAFIAEFLRYNPNLLGCFRTTQLILPPQKRESVERILYSLLRECRDASAADMVMVKSLLGELLTLLNRYVAAEPMPLEIPKRDAASEKILEVVKYINSNFAEPLSLTMLSERFFIVPTHLSRLFRRVTGFTYAEYVNRVRIRHGAKLLLETKKTVTEIALASGFNSSNHFCKIFKSVMGCSPLQYRQSV